MQVDVMERKTLPTIDPSSDYRPLCHQVWIKELDQEGWEIATHHGCEGMDLQGDSDLSLSLTDCTINFGYSLTFDSRSALKQNLRKAEASMDKLFT